MKSIFSKKLSSLIFDKLKYINFINANIIVFIIVFIKGVLTRKITTPDEYGFFTNTQLIIIYGSYLQLGVLNALNFEIPRLAAKNNTVELQNTIGSSKAYILLISILILFTIPIFYSIDISSKLKYGYIITLLLLAISLWVSMGENILRGYQEFRKLTTIMLINSIATLVISVLSTYYLGYYGLFLGMFIGNSISLILLTREIRTFKPIFNFGLMFNRIKCGFPIFVNGMLWSLLLAVGQTIGFMKLTNEEMGEFSIAIMIYSAIMIVPSIVSQIVYPKLLILTGDNNKKKIIEFYNGFFESYISILTIIAILSLLIIPELINLVLPSYSNGTTATLILLLSMFVIGTNGINANIITGYNKSKQLTLHLLLALIIMALIEILFINQFRINAISLALLIAFIVYSFLNSVFIVKKLDLPIVEMNLKTFVVFAFNILPVFTLLYLQIKLGALLFGVTIVILNIAILINKLRGIINEV